MRRKLLTIAVILAILTITAICFFFVLTLSSHEPVNKQVFSGMSSNLPAAGKAEVPKAGIPIPAKPQIAPVNPNVPRIRSYWSDAKVGDWVRFMTHKQKIAMFEIIQRDGDNITFEARHFELNGNEIPRQESDIRKINIKEDEKIQQAVLIGNPFVVRSINEWKLHKSNHIIKGDMHRVDNPKGENNISLSCRDVHVGGYTYQRRGQTPVVILVDYGDSNNPPEWRQLNPANLLKYWHEKKNWPEKAKPQEDPPGGEPLEQPEK